MERRLRFPLDMHELRNGYKKRVITLYIPSKKKFSCESDRISKCISCKFFYQHF